MFEEKNVISFRIEVVIEPDEIGFHAYCPAFKGLHVDGNTKKEALQNAKNAAIGYLESLIKHGEPIPVGINIQKRAPKISHIAKSNIIHHVEDLKVAYAN